MNIIVRNKLTEIAKKGRSITYQKLSDDCKLGLDMGNIDQRNELANILGEISIYENEFNRPLISVVVFRNDTNMPGSGFFDLATNLNKYNGSVNNKQMDAFFIKELKKCYDYWGSK